MIKNNQMGNIYYNNYQISDNQLSDYDNIYYDSSDKSDNYDDLYNVFHPEQIFFLEENFIQTFEECSKDKSSVNTDNTGNKNFNKTKNIFNVKIEYKTNLEEEINQIINKMNIDKENKEKLLLDSNNQNINIKNIKEFLKQTDSIRRTKKNQETTNKKEGEKPNLGRKRKKDNSKGNHNKYTADNIVKKIKNRISDFLIEFSNNLINSIYDIDKINKILLNLNLSKLKSNNLKQVIKKIEPKSIANLMKREDNLKILDLTLQEYLSNKISIKYINSKENNNELIISKLLDDNKNKDIFEFVFKELKVKDWIQIFIHQKSIDDYLYRYDLSKEKEMKIKDSIVGIEKYLVKLINLEKDNKIYYHCFLLLLYNFILYFSLKESRNHKNKIK